ncbi:hypothetical protein X975_01391, partial [Stegodyphus mimosarum]
MACITRLISSFALLRVSARIDLDIILRIFLNKMDQYPQVT